MTEPASGPELLAAALEACRVHCESAPLQSGEGRGIAESLGEAAAGDGLPGLEQANLLFAEALGEPGDDEQALVGEWIGALEAVLSAPGEAGVVDALSAVLADPRCASPFGPEDTAMVRDILLDAAPAPVMSATGEHGAEDDADPPLVTPGTSAGHSTAPEGEVGESLPGPLAELVALLAQELQPLGALVDEAAATIAVDPCAAAGAGAHIAEQIECFAGAAGAAGLEGLQQACDLLAGAWRRVAPADRDGGPGLDALRVAQVALAGYVTRPFQREPAQGLVEAVAALGAPVSDAELDALRALLCDVEAACCPEDDLPPRIDEATSEMVSLVIPEDVAPELLETLLQELPLLTAEFSEVVGRLAGDASIEDLNVAQRMAHTLKGAANTVGVAGIANLTHHAEDVLRAFFDAGASLSAPVVDDMVRVADCLEAMSESVTGVGPAPDDALEVLQAVLDLANRIDVDGVAASAVAAPERAAPPPAPVAVPAAPAGDEPVADAAPQDRSSEAAQGQTDGQMVRVSSALVDEFMRLTGETIILTGQVQERVARMLGANRSMHSQLESLQQLGYELEQFIDLGKAPVAGIRPTNDPLFDPLEMDEYNELHTLTRRMVEAATDAREIGREVDGQVRALMTMLADQGRLNRESHERVLETRMVPVSTVVPRLQRAVRQAGRATGKAVTLEVSGAETRMDSDVLVEVVDPLMHLLRNAVDHGIEPEVDRAAAGKQGAGRISLDFARVGNNVVVHCADDGSGLDEQAIRGAAVARGRIGPDEEIEPAALRRLILEPGFSTRTSATQVSGRGIGLDAVYTKVIALGGTFDLDSEPGAGCVVELGVPLTLISAHALLVRVRQHVFAVSTRGVEQILHAGSGELEAVGDRSIYRLGDSVHEAAMLESLLVLPPDAREADREPRTAVLTQSERGPVAVMVQEVLDSRDLVVKSLGRYVPRVRGIVGATILGDGSVTPVLDLPDLLRREARAGAAPLVADARRGAEPTALPTALVVDDSLSARRALERVMLDSGYDVRTARDGVEAAQILEGMRPDVMLVDMEMPRMNGLELVAHVRATSSTSSLPVVMVTSRSTAKHRQQAERAGVNVYLTKPFSEDELLGHVEALRTCP